MALIVHDINTLFDLILKHNEESIKFTFRQLTYKEKNKIVALTTTFNQGKAIVDSSLTCFYTIKYGLKSVEGINNPDGSPWNLQKTLEDNIEVNSDESVDSLLSSELSNGLIWAANSMLQGIPKEVVNPLTNRKIEGIEIKLHDSKKKS